MLDQAKPPAPGECDGCGAPAPQWPPVGWFDRALDPHYYSGPRRLLFCASCFAALPGHQQRLWRCLTASRPRVWWMTALRRVFHSDARRRGTVG